MPLPGYISAADGLKAALARNERRAKSKHGAGTITQAPTATPKPAVKATKPRTRIQIVAHAVETDPKCKGKAHLALAMLADDDLVAVTGPGIVKMLAKFPTPKDDDDARVQMRLLAQSSASGSTAHVPAGANFGWAGIHDDLRQRRGGADAVVQSVPTP